MVAHHGDAAFGLGRGMGGGELAYFPNVVGQRFLTIDVFVDLERGHRDHGMGVVGRGDHHHLDVVLLG